MKKDLLNITATALLAVSLSLTAQAQFSDDFNDGNDVGWTHLSIFALSTGQIWDASSGAYRLYAPANGYNPGNGSYGFIGSAVTGLTLADGTVQADIVAFQGGGTLQQPFGAFGIGTRLNNLATPLGLTGYAVAYEPYGNSGGPTLRLQWLGGPGVFNNLGAVNVNLTPGTPYTMKLQASGSSIVGSIWSGSTLIGQVSATDTHYASGSVGLVGVAQAPMPPVDTTWDNFLVVVPEPASGLLIGLGILGLFARRQVAR